MSICPLVRPSVRWSDHGPPRFFFQIAKIDKFDKSHKPANLTNLTNLYNSILVPYFVQTNLFIISQGQLMMTWMKTTIETLMELNSMNGKAAAEPEVDE